MNCPAINSFYSTDSGTTLVNVSALNPALTGATVNVPNTVGVTTVPLTTVTLSSSVATGSELRLRWVDDNAQQTSPDQIIGLDNVTITAVTSAGPVVSITSPANSASFIPGSSIVVTASASESGGTVTNVAFYLGSSLLGNVASGPYNYSWFMFPPVPVRAYCRGRRFRRHFGHLRCRQHHRGTFGTDGCHHHSDERRRLYCARQHCT